MFEHGVENREQFSHAGGQGELLRLAGREEPLVEGPNQRVVSCRGQGRHVERGPYLGPSAPNRALAPQGAAVAVEGSHSHQGRDLLAVETPNSGRLARRVVLTTGPTPGALLRRSSFSRHRGLSPDHPGEIPVGLFEIALQPLDVGEDSPAHGLADPSRLFLSAVSISTIWRRRARTADSSWLFSSGRGRGVGRTTSAKWARIWASRVSVLASRPVALAKSRTCRGFTTATGRPPSASAPAKGISGPRWLPRQRERAPKL